MSRIILGFDPGGRSTGVIFRHGDSLLAADVVVRSDDLTMPDGDYTRAVTGTAVKMLERHGFGPRYPDLIVVSEGVRYWPQSGKVHTCPVCKQPHHPSKTRNLTGVLGTAIVHGAICERWPGTVVVPPGSGHGSFHDLSYPEEIRAKPGGKGTDKMRHCRSAWDASHHGETLWLTQQRERQEGQP